MDNFQNKIDPSLLVSIDSDCILNIINNKLTKPLEQFKKTS